MSQFPHINLSLKHQQTFPANPASVVPLPDGEMLLNFASQPLVIKLDAKLEIVWEKTMNFIVGKLSAAVDGGLIAIGGMTDIQILDGEGSRVLHTIEHQPWERFAGADCGFTRDNKTIWYIIPGDETDQLQVMDATTFKVIATYPLLESQLHSYKFYTTPDEDVLLLEAAAGQEETMLMQIQLKEGVILMTELTQCADEIMGNFAPSGKEFVVAPHYDGPVNIYAFPEMALVAAIAQSTIFEASIDFPSLEPDNINYTVFFIDDNNMLVLTQFGRLLLLDRKELRCKAAIIPAEIVFTAHNMAGHPTTVPDEIYDYSSNIISVMIVHDQLLLTTAEGALRSYELPE